MLERPCPQPVNLLSPRKNWRPDSMLLNLLMASQKPAQVYWEVDLVRPIFEAMLDLARTRSMSFMPVQTPAGRSDGVGISSSVSSSGSSYEGSSGGGTSAPSWQVSTPLEFILQHESSALIPPFVQ